jgi:hypothetical protein
MLEIGGRKLLLLCPMIIINPSNNRFLIACVKSLKALPKEVRNTMPRA